MGRRLIRDEAVLVVIDLQERLLPVIDGAERVVHNAIRLLKGARLLEVPVLWTEQEKLGATVPAVRDALPMGASPIRKLTFNCLACAGFDAALGRLGRRTLILTGVETHICVLQTALAALEGGWAVHVVADATSSRAPLDREVALDRLRQAGAVVTTTETVLFELLGEAGTEAFRRILPLIKGG